MKLILILQSHDIEEEHAGDQPPSLAMIDILKQMAQTRNEINQVICKSID